MDTQQEELFIEAMSNLILEMEKLLRARRDWLANLEVEAWEDAKNNQNPF
jgi:hypothetical protein